MFGIGGLVLFSSQSGVFQIPTCGALICGDTHDPSGYHSDLLLFFRVNSTHLYRGLG